MFGGIFSMFGRSRELQQFDRELRDAGLHPALVPEPVKLTALNLLKEVGPVTDVAYVHASRLLAYCILGPHDFEAVNDTTLADQAEARVVAALGTDDGLDTQLVLLALHSGVINPSVIEHFGLEAE
jgi:hypothetical protein